jgi:uncharacterized protein
VTDRLPLFPLSAVLFPGLVLPLHIFEDRYRAMVRDLVARPDDAPHEFGVVALRRGSETAGVAPEAAESTDGPPPTVADVAVPELHEIGCTAEVRQVTELPDGRFDIVTVGRRRFRVRRVDAAARPYLVAEVEWLTEDGDGDPHELAPRVLDAFQDYLALLQPNTDALDVVPEDPTVLSHLVAASAQLALDDRQALLAAPDTTSRLRAELRLLSREAALLRAIRAVPVGLSDLARPASPN